MESLHTALTKPMFVANSQVLRYRASTKSVKQTGAYKYNGETFSIWSYEL